MMIEHDPPPVRIGTCEMCGGHNRELRVLFVGDFAGWACPQCIDQVGFCQERRFISTGESTEPIE